MTVEGLSARRKINFCLGSEAGAKKAFSPRSGGRLGQKSFLTAVRRPAGAEKQTFAAVGGPSGAAKSVFWRISGSIFRILGLFPDLFCKNACFFPRYLLNYYSDLKSTGSFIAFGVVPLLLDTERGGAGKWRNVIAAGRALALASRSPTRIDVQTGHGNPM